MNPYELDLWLMAAYYEFDVLKNPFNARKIFYKALKVLLNNKVLIDLTQIPTEIKEKIINTFEETVPAKRNKLLNYFIEYKLKNLMEVIEEF